MGKSHKFLLLARDRAYITIAMCSTGEFQSLGSMERCLGITFSIRSMLFHVIGSRLRVREVVSNTDAILTITRFFAELTDDGFA